MTKKVAIQGYEGSFHQFAAHKYFGDTIKIDPCPTFTKVINHVETGAADVGVLAIENSTAGSILQNYELLQRSNLFINGEIYLQIAQQLMINPASSFHDITEVRSHPMALYQCREYLEKHPAWQISESKDTALSAQNLREQRDKSTAVIASRLAAELYGLRIVQKNIHTEKTNYTRFLIVHKKQKPKDEVNDHKASLYFQVEDKPGYLARVLQCFGEQKVNLSKVQSFPIPGSEWQYYFHSDLEFSTTEQFDNIIECIRPLTKKLRILGVYRKGETV